MRPILEGLKTCNISIKAAMSTGVTLCTVIKATRTRAVQLILVTSPSAEPPKKNVWEALVMQL